MMAAKERQAYLDRDQADEELSRITPGPSFHENPDATPNMLDDSFNNRSPRRKFMGSKNLGGGSMSQKQVEKSMYEMS